MKKIILLVFLLAMPFAETLKAGNAYIVSSINKNLSENIGEGEKFSLVPQVVIAEGNERYIGSVSTFTGCYDGKRYEDGESKGNCLTGVINSLDSDSTTDGLSAYQGKVLNGKIEELEKKTLTNLLYKTCLEWNSFQTYNGVSYKYNANDGTFIFDGVASEDFEWKIFTDAKLTNGKYKLLIEGTNSLLTAQVWNFARDTVIGTESGNGTIIDIIDGGCNINLVIPSGYTFNNTVLKPMITTNLNATYEDFIPYRDSLVTGKDLERLSIFTDVPNRVAGNTEQIIENCKYLSSISETFEPTMFVIQNMGRGMVWGYTYDATDDPAYAQYIYTTIASPSILIIRCWEKNWAVYEINYSSVQ